MSHSALCEFEFYSEYKEWWDWYVRYVADSQARFFETLIRHCTEEGKNPIYIVRYEDLCNQPTQELTGMCKFMLDLNDLTGTNMERRIKQIEQMGSNATQTYQLKTTTGRFNASKDKYTEEQVAYIKEKLGKWLYFFGYAKHNDNPTGFFEFTAEEHSKFEKDFYGFRATNEKALATVVKDGGWKGPKYQINGDKDCFDLFP